MAKIMLVNYNFWGKIFGNLSLKHHKILKEFIPLLSMEKFTD